jgi:hypothetical protein
MVLGSRFESLRRERARRHAAMSLAQLARFQHIRDLLAARDTGASARTRLLCFSGAGFTDDLRALADRDATVQLVDTGRLYTGG